MIISIGKNLTFSVYLSQILSRKQDFLAVKLGAGVTFDWLFFDNSTLIYFDDKNVSFLRKKIYIIERERERDRERERERKNLT